MYFTLGHCRGRFDVQDLGHADLGEPSHALAIVGEVLPATREEAALVAVLPARVTGGARARSCARSRGSPVPTTCSRSATVRSARAGCCDCRVWVRS